MENNAGCWDCFRILVWDDSPTNLLGLYLDGDLEQLPLYSLFKISKKNSTEIILSSPMDASIEIKPGVTKARVHVNEGTANVYPALRAQMVLAHANINLKKTVKILEKKIF